MAAQDRRLRKVTDCVIETQNACKRYGKLRALDQVSIRVRRGEIYGLIGDNGAGKTTLLKALVGHIWCDEGTVHLLGSQSAHELNAARRQVGAMIERVGCFPSLTVEKNIEYCRMLKGIPDKRKVGEILELVGLSDKAKAKCKSLSMGMQQRLGLAIALIGEPQILILDEPINGLDPSGIHEMRELLRSLNTQKNITILLSSHILSELQQTATTFGFLAKGKLVEEIGIRESRKSARTIWRLHSPTLRRLPRFWIRNARRRAISSRPTIRSGCTMRRPHTNSASLQPNTESLSPNWSIMPALWRTTT